MGQDDSFGLEDMPSEDPSQFRFTTIPDAELKEKQKRARNEQRRLKILDLENSGWKREDLTTVLLKVAYIFATQKDSREGGKSVLTQLYLKMFPEDRDLNWVEAVPRMARIIQNDLGLYQPSDRVKANRDRAATEWKTEIKLLNKMELGPAVPVAFTGLIAVRDSGMTIKKLRSLSKTEFEAAHLWAKEMGYSYDSRLNGWGKIISPRGV